MKKEIKKRLASMQVRQDKEDAEQKAHDIYKMGPDALGILIELGLEFSQDPEDEKTKNLIRAVILTLFVFYAKNKSGFKAFSGYPQIVDLLINLSGKGFASAKVVLSDMGFSEYDLYRKQLLSLPIGEKLLRDKEISTREAYEEIRLSKNYTGFQGFMKDRYALGSDDKHTYTIYRVGKDLFALRTTKPS